MTFDWSGLTPEEWTDYCSRMENSQCYPDDYIGAVRIGELCFDLVTRKYSEAEGIVLTYDLYVGGVDSGYGYSRIEPDYPYDYAEGSDFEDSCISLSYEEFRQIAEAAFLRYLNEGQVFYTGADLRLMAEKPLHIW